MAAKKSQPAPLPRRTYGMDTAFQWPGGIASQSQLQIEMVAFVDKWPIADGGLRRVEHYHNILRILYPEYVPDKDDTWAMRMDDSLCEEKWIVWAGCSDCLDGATRLINPLTRELTPIKELCERQIAPVVMTLQGPVQAETPYLKGVADLFEVELENGSKFTVTAQHRMLTVQGFCEVGALKPGQPVLAYEPVHPPSSSAPFPLAHGEDVQNYSRKSEGFPVRCWNDSGLYGEQLPLARAAARVSSPSPADARARSRGDFGLDAPGTGCKHTPSSSLLGHLSSAGSGPRKKISDIPASRLHGQETASLESQWSQFSGQFHSGSSRPPQPPGHSPGYVHTHYSAYDSDLQGSLGFKISQTRVNTITKTSRGDFYDLHVPGAHHYFAEGAIHHNSAKTCRSSLYAVVWWICAPDISSVILSSTTGKSMRKRSWAEVRKFYTMLPGPRPGNMLDSRTMWQATKGDDKHAIVGIAVNEGPEEKAIDDIKGIHTKRQLIIIDEATSTPAAIFGAFFNLFSYPDEFQVVVIGNPWSHMDEMGKCAEPKNGWKSVSIDVEEWETIPKLDGKPGVCLRFDAEKSPNVLAGRTINRHLITAEKLAQAKRGMGEASPKYWSEKRGFWPPDGLNRTVFTESLLTDKDGYGKHIFSGTFKLRLAALDPAFGGGDRPVLRFGSLGELTNGKQGLQLEDEVTLDIDAANPKTAHYQLALQVKEQCTRRNVKPAQFGIDASGEGGGLAAIIEREWGRGIHWVEFGGAPSDSPFSEVDARRACDLYDRRVTELWYIARELLMAGQLKGLGASDAFEFCHRMFTDEKFKIILEPKKEMKLRMGGRSPDHADAVVVLIETARQNGLQVLSDTLKEIDKQWQEGVQDSEYLYTAVGDFD